MSGSRSRRGRLAATSLTATLLAAVLATSACGAAPRPSPPSGVDGLQVPTPSPDAADFVASIDNPWLPLAPGARWTRRSDDPDDRLTETTEVLQETRTVAGVEATQVVTTTTVRGEGAERLRWYAQDEDGNVWLLGEDGLWEAGVDDARAGLAMPATPRLGDGYPGWASGEEPRDVVRVGERGTSVTVPAGRFTELLELRVSGSDGTGETSRYLAEGVGEVLRLEPSGTGGPVRLGLVEHRPG